MIFRTWGNGQSMCLCSPRGILFLLNTTPSETGSQTPPPSLANCISFSLPTSLFLMALTTIWHMYSFADGLPSLKRTKAQLFRNFVLFSLCAQCCNYNVGIKQALEKVKWLSLITQVMNKSGNEQSWLWKLCSWLDLEWSNLCCHLSSA